MHSPRPVDQPNRAWYLLLLIPFIAVLWVPFYSSATPDLAGIPFFYWYQFLWVIISGVLTAIVYFATTGRRSDEQVTNVRDIRSVPRD